MDSWHYPLEMHQQPSQQNLDFSDVTEKLRFLLLMKFWVLFSITRVRYKSDSLREESV